MEKSSLFIEEDHYDQPSSIMNALKNFEINKKKLIELYIGKHIVVNKTDIDYLINHNMHYKDQYEALIQKLRAKLITQIKGKIL